MNSFGKVEGSYRKRKVWFWQCLLCVKTISTESSATSPLTWCQPTALYKIKNLITKTSLLNIKGNDLQVLKKWKTFWKWLFGETKSELNKNDEPHLLYHSLNRHSSTISKVSNIFDRDNIVPLTDTQFLRHQKIWILNNAFLFLGVFQQISGEKTSLFFVFQIGNDKQQTFTWTPEPDTKFKDLGPIIRFRLCRKLLSEDFSGIWLSFSTSEPLYHLNRALREPICIISSVITPNFAQNMQCLTGWKRQIVLALNPVLDIPHLFPPNYQLFLFVQSPNLFLLAFGKKGTDLLENNQVLK